MSCQHELSHSETTEDFHTAALILIYMPAHNSSPQYMNTLQKNE
jgi:hypothetical protein